MAHIVFVLGNYYPNFQAVGVCIRNVINELKKKHDVTIVCQKAQLNQKAREEYEGTQIIRVETKLNHFRHIYLEKAEINKGGKKKFFNIMADSVRVIRYFNALFSRRVLQNDVLNEYLKSLIKINNELKIDMLIPCVGTYESCIASLKFKIHENKRAKLMPFMFDNYAYNIAIYRTPKLFYNLKFKNHLRLEKLVIKHSEKIICMKHYAESYNKAHTDRSKLLVVEHPLIIKYENKDKFNFNNDKINIVYTGGLFMKIRSPEYALSLFEKILEKNKEIVLHFFGSGNCNLIIDKYIKKFPNQILSYGLVDIDIVIDARNNCDFLLSIGNVSNNQVPSKTFEYMAALKPIIHFAKIRNDKTNQILDKYPNKCILFEESNLLNENIETLTRFIKETKKPISFETLKKIYYDAVPTYTSELINGYLNNATKK